MKPGFANLLVLLAAGAASFQHIPAHAQTAHVQVRFAERLGPMAMDQMALGQGGLSDEPIGAVRNPLLVF